jgi:hypothetical protein
MRLSSDSCGEPIKLNQTIRLDTDLLDYVVENEKDLQHIIPRIDKAK